MERPFHQPSILLIHIDDTSELTILNEDPSSFSPSMAAGWSASFLVYVSAPKQASLFSAVQPEFVVVLLWSLDVGPGPRHSASWVSLGPPSRSNYDRKHRAMPLTHRYVGKMNISGVSQKASNSILKMPADSGPGNRIELGQKANLTGRPLSLSARRAAFLLSFLGLQSRLHGIWTKKYASQGF